MRLNRMLLTAVTLLVAATSAWALPGIQLGVHGNMQQTMIDAEVESFSFEATPTLTTSIERTEISSPIGAGVDLTITALPVIDLQISGELAATTYDIVYTPPASVGAPMAEEDIPYGRISVDATLIKPLIGLPPMANTFSLYVGVGGSYAFITPIGSQNLLVDNFDAAPEDPDLVGLAEERGTKIGFHALVGFTVKAPVLPGIRVQAKYYMFGDVDDPDSGNFVTLQAGLFI
jgi:hypothetical protein